MQWVIAADLVINLAATAFAPDIVMSSPKTLTWPFAISRIYLPLLFGLISGVSLGPSKMDPERIWFNRIHPGAAAAYCEGDFSRTGTNTGPSSGQVEVPDWIAKPILGALVVGLGVLFVLFLGITLPAIFR